MQTLEHVVEKAGFEGGFDKIKERIFQIKKFETTKITMTFEEFEKSKADETDMMLKKQQEKEAKKQAA